MYVGDDSSAASELSSVTSCTSGEGCGTSPAETTETSDESDGEPPKKNGHVYVVEDEDVEVEGGDVEVEDKDVEDEDVVAKVDQDRIKGALVVDSRLPGHGSAGGKDKYVID